MTSRLAALLLCLAAAWQTAAQDAGAAGEPSERVVIGVRTDARPFAYSDMHSGRGGYLYQLCVEAVARTGRDHSLEDATPEDRDSLLQGASRKFDVLCDPTTLTIERMRALAKFQPPGYYAFTPILFTASSVFVENAAEPGETHPPSTGCVGGPGVDRKWHGVGHVRLTTGAERIADVRMKALERWQSSATGSKPGSATGMVCAVEHATYPEAIAAFCDGEERWLIGDLDIIRETIGKHEALTGTNCSITHHETLGYEPYAFIVSSRIPGFRENFVLALYEIFSDRRAIRILDRHFGTDNRAISPYVDMLFRMYQIPFGSQLAGE